MESEWRRKMSKIETKIQMLGLILPEIPKPLASYVPAKQSGKLVFTAGQLPLVKGDLVSKGILGNRVFIFFLVKKSKNAILLEFKQSYDFYIKIHLLEILVNIQRTFS